MSQEPIQVDIRFVNAAQLRKHFLEDMGEGGLLWVTDQPLKAGEVVVLAIRVVGVPESWRIRARVAWRHAKPPGRNDLPAGVGLEFLKDDEGTIRKLTKFLFAGPQGVAVVAGDDRNSKRFQVGFLAEYLHQQELVQVPVTNISETGLYIQTKRFLVIETRLVFFLKETPTSAPRVLEGQVVWVNREGERAGMGVQFVFDTPRHQRAVRDFVRGLDHQ